MQFAAVTIANGYKVICVETERGFSVKRVRQVGLNSSEIWNNSSELLQMLEYHTSDVDVAMQRLLMSSPSTLEQMLHVLSKLETSAEQLVELVMCFSELWLICRQRAFSSVISSLLHEHSINFIAECVGAVARLCKKRCGLRITKDGMCFVANDTLREQGNFLSVLIPPRPDFEVYNFAGVSEERDEIVMELDIDDFEKSVTGVHSYLKIKLRQKPNQKPFLQLELRDKGTVHELPVKLIKTAHWPLYRRPDVPRGMMGVYFPPIKSVLRVLQSLRHVGNKNIVSFQIMNTLKVSNGGEMHLKCRMDQAEVTVYFSELANDTITEEQSQEHWCTVRLSLKIVHMFFSGFMFMANLNVLLSKFLFLCGYMC
ncbi:Hus1-like protein [Ancylostoma duodenale]|uniref:Hus1-like protein n=1 Tax=Ancylostoma duodenale TaxID=51022 RepID=A0A0C2GT97_9BILA|nr:Hus1-like protein [Ancylostoma duodenale]